MKGSRKIFKHFYVESFYSDLKGPKHEIFEGGFFTQIRPVRVDDLGTGEKIWHFIYDWGRYSAFCIFSEG